jgi:ATP/maltotriose-dependent transcriptional regulator MalT
MKLGECEKARAQYEELTRLAEEFGRPRGAAMGRSMLSWYHISRGEFRKALQIEERILPEFRRMGDRAMEANVHRTLGFIRRCLGEYASALAHYQRHVAMSREQGNEFTASLSRLSIARLLVELGDDDAAQALLDEARPGLTKHGRPEAGSFPAVLEARLLERRGDLDGALAAAAEASRASSQWGDPFDHGWTMTQEALLRLRAGEHEAAVRLLGEVRQIGPYADDPAGTLLLYTARALADARCAHTAMEQYRLHHEKVTFLEAFECAALLHRVTGEPEFLEEADRRLSYLVDHAPENYRATMVDRVPLYRDIREAFRATRDRPTTG